MDISATPETEPQPSADDSWLLRTLLRRKTEGEVEPDEPVAVFNSFI